MLFLKKQKKAEYNNNLDHKLVSKLSKTRIPNLRQLKYIHKYLNKTELTILLGAIIILAISFLALFSVFYNKNIQSQPETGGKYIEGLVGSPQYINPLYSSLNDVDTDLSKLIYSSLYTRNQEGKLIPDLAQSLKISPDEKSYTITLKSGIVWHNGNELTVDDVLFTIQNIKDPQYKSPLYPLFAGVQVQKIDQHTIQFILQEPYANFLSFLTFGILPQDLWQDVRPENMALAELNLKPIGSGPYKFKMFNKDKAGNIKSYTLEVNSDYYGAKPYLQTIVFKFFINEEELVNALNNKQIDAVSYLSWANQEKLITPNSFNFHYLHWPLLTGLFFNPEYKLTANKKIRKALSLAINQKTLIEDTLQNKVFPLSSPVFKQTTKYNYNPIEALKIFQELGWKKDQGQHWLNKDKTNFTITLTYTHNKLNDLTVQAIKNYWEKIGIETKLKAVDERNIFNTTRTKDFEVILYTLKDILENDPYPFWHSSQKNKLNFVNYENKKADKLLEIIRSQQTSAKKLTAYQDFANIFQTDLPTIFLYSPAYIYIQNKKIKGFNTLNINQPADRFSNVTSWYIKESKKLNL